MEEKTVFITGGAGYVGLTVVKEFLNKFPDAKLIVLDSFSKGRIENFAQILPSENVIVEPVDIRDYHKIEALLDKYRPETVVHLAAIVEAFSTNREGKDRECMIVNHEAAVELAKMSKEKGVKNFIFQSTVSIYSQGSNITEEGEKRPLSSYGIAKMRAEEGILSMADDSFRVVALRPATVVGFNHAFRYETIINLACIRAVYGLPLTIFESAHQNDKTYLHLQDNARAILFTLDNISRFNGEVFNVTSFNVNLETVLRLIEKELGRPFNYTLVKEKAINQQVYTISSEKIEKEGFTPSRDIETTIAETLAGIVSLREKLMTLNTPTIIKNQ